ncbi:MAG TPA: TonB-dependent receptor [Rhizomicrobium sp.]
MLRLRNDFLVGASVMACFVVLAGGTAFAQKSTDQAETVIVTGTRVQGMSAADSAAPITVLGSDALTHGVGSTDLRQQLAQSVPSFTAQNYGGDTANLTLNASLRSVSPNDTLVLVNGHRRHYTANLQALNGGAAPDISLIPSGAIDHVEVLLNGAAAQYGTDAVAGVVNIILKKKSSGGNFSVTAGNYSNHGDLSVGNSNGEKYDISYNMGLPLFDKGFLNVTVDKSYQNFTQYGGADNRLINVGANGVIGPAPQSTVTSVGANGVANLSTVGNGVPTVFNAGITGYPRANAINGNPELQMTLASVNAGYDFNDDVSIYAFGTFGHKFGKSYENVRVPNQVVATIGSNQPCSANNLVGYATGSSTANGLNPSCTGAFPILTADGFSAAPGTPGAGLNPRSGQVISSGNAGNLYSTTLIDARTGALLPSATNAGTLGTMPELVFAPKGFSPMEVMKEDDYQYNAGIKFKVAGWDVDADLGYAKDIASMYTWNSANNALFIDTHTTPTNFYAGTFTASQFTGTIDAEHPFNVGLASPLTVAIGVEAREDLYGISSGDAASYYKEGAQGYPGFSPQSAGVHSRKNYAGYIDLAVAPIEALQLDVAGRAEHYTDFGDTQIGKITARYDFSPSWAIRGTISTGFRAPTIAEEYYTNVNVTPNQATLQLPANSDAAKMLGLENLKPEVSVNYSAGIVAHPLEDLSVTVDAYSIKISNRITTSSTVKASGTGIVAPDIVFAAIHAAGVILDPTATQAGVTAYLNGISTISQGVDLTVNYPTDFNAYGLVNWTLAGNYNESSVRSLAPAPAPLVAENPNASFFTSMSVFGFNHSAPTHRIGLTANWSLDEFGATVRETYYGPRHAYSNPGSDEYIPQNVAAVGITDTEGRYNITEQLSFSLGINNLFNIRGRATDFAPDCSGPLPGVIFLPGGKCTNGPNKASGVSQLTSNGNVAQTLISNQYDPNGSYYYARVNFNF